MHSVLKSICRLANTACFQEQLHLPTTCMARQHSKPLIRADPSARRTAGSTSPSTARMELLCPLLTEKSLWKDDLRTFMSGTERASCLSQPDLSCLRPCKEISNTSWQLEAESIPAQQNTAKVNSVDGAEPARGGSWLTTQAQDSLLGFEEAHQIPVTPRSHSAP